MDHDAAAALPEKKSLTVSLNVWNLCLAFVFVAGGGLYSDRDPIMGLGLLVIGCSISIVEVVRAFAEAVVEKIEQR